MGTTYYSIFKNSNGDVGIGTASPTAQSGYRFLQVNGSTSAIIEATVGGTRIGGFDSTASALYVGTIGSYPVIFRTAVDEKMRISANGNVGIGTSSPGSKLDVNGTFRTAINNLTIFNDYIYVSPTENNTLNSAYFTNGIADMWINYAGYNNGNTQFRNFNIGNGKNGVICWFDGTNKRMSINNSQSASYTLHVNGDGYFASTLYVADNVALNLGNSSQIYHNSTRGTTQFTGTGGADTVCIKDSNGYVGIGTTSPNYALDVNGVIGLYASSSNYRRLAQASNWGYSSSYRTIILGSSSSTYNAADGAVTLCFGVDISANSNSSFTGDGRELVFRNLTKFVIPNSANTAYLNPLTFNNGNVGIGTDTPTAYTGYTSLTAAYPLVASRFISAPPLAALNVAVESPLPLKTYKGTLGFVVPIPTLPDGIKNIPLEVLYPVASIDDGFPYVQ